MTSYMQKNDVFVYLEYTPFFFVFFRLKFGSELVNLTNFFKNWVVVNWANLWKNGQWVNE
jgi:hypothetical protein